MKHQNNAGFKAGGTGGTKRFTLLPILISYQVPRTPGGADKSYLRKELKNLNPSSHQIATLNPFLCLCGIRDIQNRSYFNITSSIQQLFSIKIMKNTNLVCIEIKICTY